MPEGQTLGGWPQGYAGAWRRIGPWLVAALVVALLAALLREVEGARLLSVLRSADPGRLILAISIGLSFNTYARIRRRLVLMAAAWPARALTTIEAAPMYLAACAANNLLPARAGDLLFGFELKRKYDYPLAAGFAAQLAEKVVEVGSLWLLVPLCLGFGHLEPLLLLPLYVFLAGGAMGLTLLAVLMRARPGAASTPPLSPSASSATSGGERFGALRGGMRRSLEAAARLASPGVAWRAVLWSCCQDLADIAMVALVAQCLSIDIAPIGWVVTYLAVNLASALPGAPGQIGLIEAGAILALVGLGVGQTEALAFAVLYHAAHLLPLTLAGALPLARMRLWRRASPDYS